MSALTSILSLIISHYPFNLDENQTGNSVQFRQFNEFVCDFSRCHCVLNYYSRRNL